MEQLPYLKLLYSSLRRNSEFKHKLYAVDNGSTDGTSDWLESQGIEHVTLHDNHGFCAVNEALKIATNENKYVMVFNTDMVPLRFWDVAIATQIRQFESKNIEKFTISCRLVEPTGNNPEYVIADYGQSPDALNMEALLRFSPRPVANTNQYSHPILFPSKMLQDVEYFDQQYWPGWASDHDIAMKCSRVGCKNFVMLGNSHVYHFSSATFNKLKSEDRAKDGQDIFKRKWNISVDEFRRQIQIRSPFSIKDNQ